MVEIIIKKKKYILSEGMMIGEWTLLSENIKRINYKRFLKVKCPHFPEGVYRSLEHLLIRKAKGCIMCLCEQTKKKYLNKKYNKLQILSVFYRKSTLYSNCKCDCGKEKIIRLSNVARGITKSCGCFKSLVMSRKAKGNTYRRKERGVSDLNAIYDNYLVSARRRNKKLLLTKEQVKELITSNCFYCDKPPSNKRKSRDHTLFYYNGIDRLDTNRDYEIGNVVPCCCFCNKAKLDNGVTDFLTQVENIYNRLPKIKEMLGI